MKKLLVIFMVLAFVAPAFAADNLSLSGQVRVRSWDSENYSDFDDDGADKFEYIEQRFRLQTVYKANDQVKAVLRTDFSEDKWGSANFKTFRYNDNDSIKIFEEGSDITDPDAATEVGKKTNNSVIQVDRAYMDITTGPVNVKVGQQFLAVGQSQVLRDNKPGIQITIKTPVVVELGYSVEQDEDAGATNDQHTAHISLDYKADAFSVQAFYGQETTTITGATPAVADLEDLKTVFGVNGKFSVGPVKINTELALFGGDDDAGTDYMGTQFNIDADMKLSDMVKVGADLFYSDGTDGDSDEAKIVNIGDRFGILSRAEGGSGNNYWAGDLAPLGGQDVFDPNGLGQGGMGLGVDVVITPMAGLDLLAHVLYISATEDTFDDSGYDTALVYNLGVTYALAPKAKLGLYYNAVTPDLEDGDASDDAASIIGGLIQIAF